MENEKKKLNIRKLLAENSALVSFLALLIFAIIVKGSTFLDPNNIMNILRNKIEYI